MDFLRHLGKGRYSAVRWKPELKKRSQQEQTVAGYLRLRETADGVRIPDLALRHAEQRLLIAVIAFALPAVDIGLHERDEIQFRIGADQKRRVAIEQFGAIAQTIAERFDDHRLNRHSDARFAPVDGAQHLSPGSPKAGPRQSISLWSR
jgi:hypothetical protein